MEMRRVGSLTSLVERLAALEESLRTGTTPAAGSTPPVAVSGGGQTIGGKGGATNIPPRSRAVSATPGGVEPSDVKAYASPSETSAPAAFDDGPTTVPPVLTLVPPPGPQAAGAATATARAADNPAPQPSSVASPRPPAQSSTIEAIKAGLEKRTGCFSSSRLRARAKPWWKMMSCTSSTRPKRSTCATIWRSRRASRCCARSAVRRWGATSPFASPSKSGKRTKNPNRLSAREQERSEKQRLREIAEQNPFTQQVLSTFRGEIVDVRRIDSGANSEK